MDLNQRPHRPEDGGPLISIWIDIEKKVAKIGNTIVLPKVKFIDISITIWDF